MLIVFGNTTINMNNITSFTIDKKKSSLVFSTTKNNEDNILLSFFANEDAQNAYQQIIQDYHDNKRAIILKPLKS